MDTVADGSLVATGSRTAGVVSLADDLERAEASVEEEVNAIKGDLFHRVDVGTAPLVASRVKRMIGLHAECYASSGARVVKVGVLGSTRGSSLPTSRRANEREKAERL